MAKKNKKGIRHSWSDKIIYIILLILTAAPVVLDIFIDIIPEETIIKIVCILISVLSGFFAVVSFVLDKKFNNIRKEILIGETTDIDEQPIYLVKKELIDEYGKVQQSAAELIKVARHSITDSFLSNKENDIHNYLNCAENEYIVIYIITNSLGVETDNFSNPIRKNILDNVQYVYITSHSDREFHRSLRPKIVLNESDRLLRAAYQKNIHHISKPEYFQILPSYSDMVFYTKKQYVDQGERRNIKYGFYCFQNDVFKETVGGKTEEFYFYQEMDRPAIDRVLNQIDNMHWWDSVKSSEMSEKIEVRQKGNGRNGLFVKPGETLRRDEVVFRMGGIFLEEKPNNLDDDDVFLQIDPNHYLGFHAEGKDTAEAHNFRADHSCTPNCSLKDDEIITFISMRDISEGEEILIDYRKMGVTYTDMNFVCDNTQCPNFDQCPNKNLFEYYQSQSKKRIKKNK